MKRKTLLFLLLLTFFAPWTASAQTSLTVHNSTNYNSYVPIMGNFTKAYLKCQMVYPAAELEDMAEGSISALKFYTSQQSFPNLDGIFQILIKEIEATTLSNYIDVDDAVIVYQGQVNVAYGEWNFDFTQNYTYGGSNLLIAVYQIVPSSGKSPTSFYGEEVPGASLSGFSYTNLASVNRYQRSFLPKTTFTYTPCAYPSPVSIDFTHNGPGNTTVSWTAPETALNVTGYAYRCKATSATEWPEFTSVPATTTSVTLSLAICTEYQFEVKALYDGEHESCLTKEISFTTTDVCMTPENLTITNVIWNAATISWTESYGDGQWKLGYKKSTETAYMDLDVTLAQLPYTLAGLDATTSYDVKIYPLCNPEKSITGSFTTQCDPVTSIIENFDRYGGVINGSTNNLPACWNYINTSTDNLYKGYPVIYFAENNAYSSYYVLRFYSYTGGDPKDQYAILPPMENVNTLRIQLYAKSLYGANCIVGVMTDPTDASTFVPVETIAPTTDTYTKFSIDLDGYTGMGNYIAIKMPVAYSPSYRGIQIDNLVVESIPTCQVVDAVTVSNVSNYSAQLGWTAAEGQNAWQIAYKAGSNFDPNDVQQLDSVTFIDVTTNPYTFCQNLTPNTHYYMYVRANCGDCYSAWTPPVTFTTLKENDKVFTTAGNWTVADNWIPAGVPEITNDVIIRANATIPNECDALANSITFEGTPTPTLTIKDGGQLHTNQEVLATVEKEITHYTGTNDHYYLIATPGLTFTTSDVENLLTGTFDFYAFDGTQEGEEWRNHKVSPITTMHSGCGYLYANAADVTLRFTDTVPAQSDEPKWANGAEELNYDEDTPFGTFNLIGNMLPHNGYVYIGTPNLYDSITNFEQTYYYRMNGDELVVSNNVVKPCEGVFVQATAEGQYAVVFSESQGNTNTALGLRMNLTSGSKRVDVAIIEFGQGNNLSKFQLNQNHTKLYLPVDGEDYAVVFSDENVSEMPVSFKAENNGNYTLSFDNKNVEFGYLHLVDNLTGNDVDLLETPNYSFDAKTTDYASRFKLVFAVDGEDIPSTGSGAFAFMGDSNLIVSNKGKATLQVIDVNGRILRSESINGSTSINMNTVPGVYILRLINGENVKTQKMVVK